MSALLVVCHVIFAFTIGFLLLFTLRHHWLGLFRLRLNQFRDSMELCGFVMPSISVLVPMHNEERVAADVLQALVECDYDWQRLEILAIDDRSQDSTAKIVDEFAAKYPIIKAIHRQNGNGGKPGVLEYATPRATGEVLVLFDADYIPGRAMLKMLVAPLCDPEIGAVMGRVVPHNAGDGVLPCLLSLERAAGYQVGQQARFNANVTPQFGGTVGAVRASALRAVGGWNTASLTEDTDLTCELLAAGWQVAYVNRAECYEEVPKSWPVRRRQLARWVMGHTDCMHRFLPKLLWSNRLPVRRRIDAAYMLSCYMTAPVLVLGWIASLAILLLEPQKVPLMWVALAILGCQTFGNQATFFELGSAALLDGTRERVLMMPVNLFNFFASTGAICGALLKYYVRRLLGRGSGDWQKTSRSRTNGGAGVKNPPKGSSNSFLVRAPNGLYLGSSEALRK
jgi:cellulose synthase/poly-beta-1,6-N-acetylglucosamine synthase-like glycosyltransferase